MYDGRNTYHHLSHFWQFVAGQVAGGGYRLVFVYGQQHCWTGMDLVRSVYAARSSPTPRFLLVMRVPPPHVCSDAALLVHPHHPMPFGLPWVRTTLTGLPLYTHTGLRTAPPSTACGGWTLPHVAGPVRTTPPTRFHWLRAAFHPTGRTYQDTCWDGTATTHLDTPPTRTWTGFCWTDIRVPHRRWTVVAFWCGGHTAARLNYPDMDLPPSTTDGQFHVVVRQPPSRGRLPPVRRVAISASTTGRSRQAPPRRTPDGLGQLFTFCVTTKFPPRHHYGRYLTDIPHGGLQALAAHNMERTAPANATFGAYRYADGQSHLHPPPTLPETGSPPTLPYERHLTRLLNRFPIRTRMHHPPCLPPQTAIRCQARCYTFLPTDGCWRFGVSLHTPGDMAVSYTVSSLTDNCWLLNKLNHGSTPKFDVTDKFPVWFERRLLPLPDAFDDDLTDAERFAGRWTLVSDSSFR